MPDQISVITDPILIVQDKKDEIEEEKEGSQELSWNLSPLTQSRPTPSSGSPELQLPVVEKMLSWINNSRLFDDVLPPTMVL
jgi:hypothetical protein